MCRRTHTDGDHLVCPSCLGKTRADIGAVVALTMKLAEEAVHGRAALAVRGIPGGDAVVLASPGGTEAGWVAQLLHRFLFGLDVSHVRDERRHDPNPPLAVLTHWEDRVRRMLDQPTDLDRTLTRAADYLSDHLGDVARDVMFVPMARTLSATVRQLEDVLLDGERPERSRVPCLDCGARLEKVYAARLSEDHYTCPRCGERYDQGRFERAKHDHLASEGADRYVFIPDAAVAIGRPEQTVRAWVRKGSVMTTRDAAGRLVVWWPDIRTQHLLAARRTTRKATAR